MVPKISTMDPHVIQIQRTDSTKLLLFHENDQEYSTSFN